jgi:16S rRNA (uracil1498-N3)-methyltransferase
MQRYFALKKIEQEFILEEKDYHHIKNVMRMNESDEIEVVIDQTLYLACIQNVKENMKIIEVKKLKEEKTEEKKYNILIPYLKEQKLDFILQKATELGVNTIYLVPLERSIIKEKEQNKETKKERWNRILKEASEQSKRLSVPKLICISNIKELENLEGLKLVCSTKEKENTIKKVVKKNHLCDTINVIAGPEGGLTEKEEEQLINMGFIPVTFGNRILRVETVPLYILSILNYEFME